MSFIAGRGKKTAWGIWHIYQELTPVLARLSVPLPMLDDASMAIIERFVILLYDKTSVHSLVNISRQHLFATKTQNIESIPPSQAALHQHLLRALFQGAIVWGQALIPKPYIPSPEQWGWNMTEHRWRPNWTTLPQAKDTCYELIHCRCKKRCTGNCKCFKANLDCTALCLCGGHFFQDS